MARTVAAARLYPEVGAPAALGRSALAETGVRPLRSQLLRVIGLRAGILLVGINLASPLGMLPSEIGAFPAAAFWSILTVAITAAYLAFWRDGRLLRQQLLLQIGSDLVITTLLVAQTGGEASAFASFYLLVIICCSMTLGRNGGIIGAALSSLLYAGVVGATGAGVIDAASPGPSALAFRLGIHVLGFFAVAFLGANLSHRLQAVQKQLEESTDSLRRLQRLNELVVSSIRSGLATTDLNGRIASFNVAAEELTKRKTQEIQDEPVGRVLGPGLWQRIRETDFFRDSRPLRHEEWVRLPDDTSRYLGFSVSPLLDEGRRVLGFVVSFQDLTEIKRLEEEIRIKERMAAVGQMAAGIAHEIRNPLTSMRGSAEILRSHLTLPSGDQRLLDILMRESDRLNKFVEDFLSFARPRDPARCRVELIALLRDAVALLQNNPEVRDRHAVELEPTDREITIWANPDQLRQVFWNLAHNAIRAMPRGGTLRIRASRGEDGGCAIEFRDEGVGMTPHQRAQIFQPFHSGFSGGTGLGLSIVYQIVAEHEGTIEVASEQDRGTAIILRLPPGRRRPDLKVESANDALCTARG